MRVKDVVLGGKSYPYVYCGRCGVWVQVEEYHYDRKPRHDKCNQFKKTKEIRARATRRVLGLLNNRAQET